MAVVVLMATFFCASSLGSPPLSHKTTPSDLLGMLDPKQPEAAAILNLRSKKGDSVALVALVRHFRLRPNPGWPIFDLQSTVCPPDPEVDSALAGTHRAIGIWHRSAKEKIDWYEDPTGKNGRPPDVEWLFGRNRHQWWPGLACRGLAPHGSIYLATLDKEVNSWLSQCPVPEGRRNAKGSTWRTIEAGIRMLNAWPSTFERARRAPGFPDSTLLRMVAAMVDHAEYLQRFKTDHNWLAMEMDGLHAVGSILPEFSRSSQWRNTAIRTIDSAMRDQLLPDGVQEELSPSYHSLTLWCTRDILLRSRATGRKNELPLEFANVLEKGYDVLVALRMPDGDHPRLNDSHDIDILQILSQGLELFPHRADWRWIVSKGASGMPPAYTSRLFPWAGWCIFRTSWDPTANALVFDRGAPGKGHEHQDKLSISAWAYGRQILFDDGGGAYEDSPYRKYSLSTKAHSTVLVDGKGQNRAPTRPTSPDSTRHELRRHPQWVAGSYEEGWGDDRESLAVHRRSVAFGVDIWIVEDLVRSRDDRPHRAIARWQILSTRIECDSLACATTDSGKANLTIVPLSTTRPVATKETAIPPPDVSGWYNGQKRRFPSTTLVHDFGPDSTHRWLTLLIPSRPGADSRIKVASLTFDTIKVEMMDERRWRLARNPSSPLGWKLLPLPPSTKPN